MHPPSCPAALLPGERRRRACARRQASGSAFLYAQRGLLAALLADAAARPAEARRLPYLLSAFCDAHGLLARAPGDAAALQEVRQRSAHAGARPRRRSAARAPSRGGEQRRDCAACGARTAPARPTVRGGRGRPFAPVA